MQVLWWLVPPVVATGLAMVWVAFAGRSRDDAHRDDSEESLRRMEAALARPAPRRGVSAPPVPAETSHGVAVRRVPRRPGPETGVTR